MTHLPNFSLTKHQHNINNSATPTGRVHVGTGFSFTKCDKYTKTRNSNWGKLHIIHIGLWLITTKNEKCMKQSGQEILNQDSTLWHVHHLKNYTVISPHCFCFYDKKLKYISLCLVDHASFVNTLFLFQLVTLLFSFYIYNFLHTIFSTRFGPAGPSSGESNYTCSLSHLSLVCCYLVRGRWC